MMRSIRQVSKLNTPCLYLLTINKSVRFLKKFFIHVEQHISYYARKFLYYVIILLRCFRLLNFCNLIDNANMKYDND